MKARKRTMKKEMFKERPGAHFDQGVKKIKKDGMKDPDRGEGRPGE